ncbi:MAG: methyltransferase domain-containing protein [Cyanothece sp. SIO2G6]|nr:methyltransferase domain-containing protein [Cyanothece sp. SIO2G6]
MVWRSALNHAAWRIKGELTGMKLCKVADIRDWDDPEFQDIASLVRCDTKNHKTWEFIQVYKGLKHLGLLDGQAACLGLGVGHECLIYAFTNVCQSVVATDLYESQNWSTASMGVEDVYQRNPMPYDRSKLSVRHMDMTQIEYPDESFDFVWSCCSVEHVHNFTLLHQVYQEIHRVLKPGGIAALTTEFNSTDWHSYEPNMLFTDAYWLKHWLEKEDCIIQGLQLLDPIDLSLSDDARNLPHARRDPGHSIQICCDDVVLNSVAFFLRKTADAPTPYVEASWLPEFWQLYLKGCDCRREGQFEQAESLFKSLLDLDTLEKRDRIRTLHYLGNVLAVQNKLDEAKDIAQELLQLCQSDPPLADQDYPVKPIASLMAIASFCDNIGFPDEAQELYRKVILSKASTMDVVIRSFLKQSDYYREKQDYTKALSLLDEATQILQHNAFHQEFNAKIQYAYGKCLRDLNQPEKMMRSYWQLIQGESEILAHFPRLLLDFINNCLTDESGKNNTISIKIGDEIIDLAAILEQVSRHLTYLANSTTESNNLLARLYLCAGVLSLKLQNQGQEQEQKQEQDEASTLQYFEAALKQASFDSPIRSRAQKRIDNILARQARSQS